MKKKKEENQRARIFFIKNKRNDYSSMTHKTQNKRAIVFVCDKYKNANGKRKKRVRNEG